MTDERTAIFEAGVERAAAGPEAIEGQASAPRVGVEALRTGFGWFVLMMASVILAQEIDPTVGAVTATLTVVSGALYASCRRGLFCPLRALYPRG